MPARDVFLAVNVEIFKLLLNAKVFYRKSQTRDSKEFDY